MKPHLKCATWRLVSTLSSPRVQNLQVSLLPLFNKKKANCHNMLRRRCVPRRWQSRQSMPRPSTRPSRPRLSRLWPLLSRHCQNRRLRRPCKVGARHRLVPRSYPLWKFLTRRRPRGLVPLGFLFNSDELTAMLTF